MSDRMFSILPPLRPELERLLREAAKRKMTPAEVREQRISFVYGQMMDCAPLVTKEQIAMLHDEIYGTPKP